MTTMEAQQIADGAAAPDPDVRGGVVPYLCVEGATKAAAFYEKAFGGRIVVQQPEDEQGRTMHVHLHVNGGSLMLCDPYPDYGHPFQPHQGYTLHLQVEDVEAWWERAVAAGVEIVLPLQVMFWGDRYGQVRDPYGVLWSLGGPAEKD